MYIFNTPPSLPSVTPWPQLAPLTFNLFILPACVPCSGCRGEESTTENVSANSSRKANVEIKVSDRNVTIIQRNEMMPSCCDGIDLCKCPQIKTTKIDTSAIHAVIASEKNVTCCTYFVTYMVWFFCGLCGAHYWLHKKRFRQTKAHRAFLCCWCLSCGCCCIPCCIDGYRIYYWLQSYTIKLYGEYEQGTLQCK